MALNGVTWAPEAQLLLGLLGLLYYGTGPVVTPVAEALWVPKSNATNSNRVVVLPAGGPLHGPSHLTWWAVVWCLLGALLIWTCPFGVLQAGGVFLRDSFSVLLGTALFVYAALAIAIAAGWSKQAGIAHTEYFVLVLLAVLGQYLLLMTTDLMALYLCLELQSFALVVLCSLNYASPYSVEAGMKYFLLSAFSSCLLLLGIGLIYWNTGLTRCAHLQELLAATAGEPSLGLWLGIWLVGLGLLWKLAAAPIHMWAADVYQGAWSSVTLLISTLPKIAVLGFWAHTWHSIWCTAFGGALAFFSAFSLVVGAVAPLGQAQLKRLLAFSSIGHMGLLLMPLAGGTEGLAALWAHLAIYVVTSLAVWGLMLWPFDRPGGGTAALPVLPSQTPGGSVASEGTHTAVGGGAAPQYVWDLAGLQNSLPVAATAWASAMLSLAGLPPVAGFLGKLGLFWWGLNTHQYALVILALVATLLGSVYYLRVLKVAYVDTPRSWGTFGPCAVPTAYLIAIAWVVLAGALWHGAPLVLATHLLALATSIFH